jgi:predicted dehydrogenase
MVNIGLIGCGKIGARHLDAYKQIGRVNVVASDVDPVRAKMAASQWDVEAAPIESLFERAFDAVDVCVPSSFHAEWIIKALEAGCHVFCEKPLCLSYTEGQQIERAARLAQRNVTVGYLYRHHPAFRYAKDTIEHGIIGDPYFSLARLGGRGSHQPWKHEGRGGGAFFEMMVHMLDLVSWLLGPLTDGRILYQDVLLPTRDIDGDSVAATAMDCVVVTLKAGGIKAVCQSDLTTPSFMNQIEVQGANGSILASILDFIPTVVYCKEPRVLFDRGHNFRRFGPANLFVKELSSFVDMVSAGETNEWSLHESLELARFMDEMVAAGESRDGTRA